MSSEVLASVIIPVAAYHSHLYSRAVDSVLCQSIPVELLVQHDTAGYGPSWARNEGAKQARGLFLVFLDADDWLESHYVETAIQYYRQGFYVYSDHLMDGEIQCTADCLDWRTGAWHGVTSLFPKALFDYIGGFKDVPQAEDSEFYLRAQSKGVCGIRAPFPLFSYGAGGRRSKDFHSQHSKDDRERILDGFRKANPAVTTCGNCPQLPNINVANEEDKQAGDVLVETLYAPSRLMGVASGRFYKRALYTGMQLWADPRDLAAMPDYFKQVFMPADIAPDIDTVLALAQEALASK